MRLIQLIIASTTVSSIAIAWPVAAHSEQVVRRGIDLMSPAMRDRLAMYKRLPAPHLLHHRVNPGVSKRRVGIRSVVNRCAVWTTRQSIDACFLDGNKQFREKFVSISKKWFEHRPNLLNFGSGPEFNSCNGNKKVPIRIGFKKEENVLGNLKAHWSCIGRNSLRGECGSSAASLNINSGLLDGSDLDFRTVVLHEFGHALGLEHEHQNPNGNCFAQLDFVDIVIPEYAAMGYKEDEIRQMFEALEGDGFISEAHDPESVMHYAIPAEYFKSDTPKTCLVPRASELSDDDTEAAEKFYPPIGEASPNVCEAAGSRFLSSVNLTGPQMAAFASEIASTVAAGANRMRKIVFSRAHPENVPIISGKRRRTFPPRSIDCTPSGLRGTANCSVEAGRIEIDINPRLKK